MKRPVAPCFNFHASPLANGRVCVLSAYPLAKKSNWHSQSPQARVRKDQPLRAIRATVDEVLTELQSTGGRRGRTSCRTVGEAVAGAVAADAVSTAELISTNLLHENEGY
jgi:hypothetical protein